MWRQAAFLPPPCCSKVIYQLVDDILAGGGEEHLDMLCPICRTGKGIVLDVVEEPLETWQIRELKKFSEETGFRLTILTTEEERANHLCRFYEHEKLPGAMQSALALLFHTRAGKNL